MDRNRHMATRTPHPVDNVHRMSPTILERFPAGAPRGSWPAEEYAAARRADGQTVEVRMDLPSDSFIVVKAGA